MVCEAINYQQCVFKSNQIKLIITKAFANTWNIYFFITTDIDIFLYLSKSKAVCFLVYFMWRSNICQNHIATEFVQSQRQSVTLKSIWNYNKHLQYFYFDHLKLHLYLVILIIIAMIFFITVLSNDNFTFV